MKYRNGTPKSPDAVLKTFSIIHLALLAGQILFGIVVFAQASKVFWGIKDTDDPFVYIVPLVAIGGFAGSNIVFNQKLKALVTKNTLGEKMTGYTSALISRFAFLEAPSLFAIAVFRIESNLLYLVISGMLILYFLTLRPTLEKIEGDLNLTFEEKMELLKEDEAVK